MAAADDDDWSATPSQVARLLEARAARWKDSPKEKAARSRALKMALAGYQVSRSYFLDPRKPWCDSPVFLSGKTSPYKEGRTLLAESWVPCRKCAKCLTFRRLRWRQRALAEIAAARRTWFVTLTMSPIMLAGVLAESRRFARLGEDASVDRAAYGHVQKYLKRLRKASKVRLRYLVVFERGETTGRPHYHMLIHECGPRPLGKRDIENCWHSNVHARLVAEDGRGSASYVTKYATKSSAVRLRASSGYGKAEVPDDAPRKARY